MFVRETHDDVRRKATCVRETYDDVRGKARFVRETYDDVLLEQHLLAMGLELREGRADSAPLLSEEVDYLLLSSDSSGLSYRAEKVSRGCSRPVLAGLGTGSRALGTAPEPSAGLPRTAPEPSAGLPGTALWPSSLG